MDIIEGGPSRREMKSPPLPKPGYSNKCIHNVLHQLYFRVLAGMVSNPRREDAGVRFVARRTVFPTTQGIIFGV